MYSFLQFLNFFIYCFLFQSESDDNGDDESFLSSVPSLTDSSESEENDLNSYMDTMEVEMFFFPKPNTVFFRMAIFPIKVFHRQMNLPI